MDSTSDLNILKAGRTLSKVGGANAVTVLRTSDIRHDRVVAVLTRLTVSVFCLQLRHRTRSFPGRTALQLLQNT